MLLFEAYYAIDLKMLNSIKRAGFRFRVGTSDPSSGTLVEPKYFQVLALIWTTTLSAPVWTGAQAKKRTTTLGYKM